MIRIGFLFLLLSSFSFAEENILIISDIDDTVKITHQRDLKEAIKNTFKTDNQFYGMSELFQSIVEEQGEENVSLNFVTNARYFLNAKYHRHFLEKGKFPASDIFFWSGTDHKVRKISELIESHPDHAIIMIGDNGEKDVLYYDEIVHKYPKREFFSFIRLAYSPDEERVPELKNGQIGFATPLEISLQLALMDILMPEQLEKLFSVIVPQIVGASEKIDSDVFPSWINCNRFKWNSDWDHMLFSDEAKKASSVIQKRCSGKI